MTGTVITGQHGEDAGRRWAGPGGQSGFMWRAKGSYRETQTELRQELQGWHLRLARNGQIVPTTHETDGGTGGSWGLQGHKTDPRSHGW